MSRRKKTIMIAIIATVLVAGIIGVFVVGAVILLIGRGLKARA